MQFYIMDFTIPFCCYCDDDLFCLSKK